MTPKIGRITYRAAHAVFTAVLVTFAIGAVVIGLGIAGYAVWLAC